MEHEWHRTYLVGGTALVGTEHDHVGGGIGEFFLMKRLVVAKQLHVSTTALKALLQLDFILYNESLALVVNFCGKLGRDGVVSSGVLKNQTLVASNAREDVWLLDRPLANVGPVFLALGVLLLRIRDLPSRLPVLGELFEERGLYAGGLSDISYELPNFDGH